MNVVRMVWQSSAWSTRRDSGLVKDYLAIRIFTDLFSTNSTEKDKYIQ
jgi:hypothetical protein